MGWDQLMASLDWLIDGFESIDRLVVALFDGSLIWFWFDGGLTVVALFFFFFFSLSVVACARG